MSLPTPLFIILCVGIPLYVALFIIFTFFLWRKYLRVGRTRNDEKDTDRYGLTDEFPQDYLMNNPHQDGVKFYHQIFERSAKRFPDVCAVRIAGSDNAATLADSNEQLGRPPRAEPLPHQMSVTYATLNDLSSKIAYVLLHGNADQPPYVSAPDNIVAVLLPRVSVHIFAAQLGALKAGAGALMLDCNLPEAVLAYQVSDSKPVAVLTLECYVQGRSVKLNKSVQDLKSELFGGHVPLIDLDDVFRSNIPTVGSTHGMNAHNVLTALHPSHLAMVIYTSGTTGKPKAVLVEHAGYVNYTLDYCHYMNLVPYYDTHGQMASLSFDASLEELYGAWCAGVPLVVFTDAQIRSGPDLAPILCSEGVTAISLVPSLLSTISRRPEYDFPFPLLRYITVGGEAITESLVQPWTRGRRELVNSYGPTEATIVICRLSLREGQPVTIGTPVAGMSLFCIDHEAIETSPKGAPLKVLPHGMSGELCTGGIQVARGYLNQAELTAQKFVDDSGTFYGRTYRTGDLCCIDKNTKLIIYQGRIDQQVKIRGNRIELGTVENALLNDLRQILDDYDKVEEGQEPIMRDDPIGAKQGDILIGFLCVPNYFRRVKTGTEDVGSEKIPMELVSKDLQTQCKQLLSNVLPPPAIPSQLVFVPHLPRQVASGKINRKALPNAMELLATVDVGPDAPGDEPAHERKGPAAGSEEEKLMQHPEAVKCLQACREFLPTLTVAENFVEAGADSIMIAKLVGALREFMPTVTVSDLIRHKTLGKLMLGLLDTSSDSKDRKGMDDAQDAALEEIPCGKSCTLHPYMFSLLQCLFLVGYFAATFLSTIFMIVFMLDFWDWAASEVLPSSMGDNFALTALALFPILGIMFFTLDLLIKVLIAVPVYRIGLCWCVGSCCMRFQVGVKYPKWSAIHLYLWMRLSIERKLRSGLLVEGGDEMKSFMLRCLGAKIGWDVVYGHDVNLHNLLAGYLKIGQMCIIGDESSLVTCKLDQSSIMVAPVTLEHKVRVGARAYLGPGSIVRKGCMVDHITCIYDFFSCDVEDEIISGVPAKPTGISVHTLPFVAEASHKRWHEKKLPLLLFIFLSLLLLSAFVFALDALLIAVFWSTWPFNSQEEFDRFFSDYDRDASDQAKQDLTRQNQLAQQQLNQNWITAKNNVSAAALLKQSGGLRPFVQTVPNVEDWQSNFMRSPFEIFGKFWLPMFVYGAFTLAILVSLIIVILSIGLLRNPLLRVKVGSYPKRSITGILARLKLWVFNIIQREMFGYNCKAYVMSLSGVTFEPSCGCSELATCYGLIPETTVIGANSFWADDCICTQVTFEGQCIKIQRARFPQNFFIGNSAVIEPASQPTNYLVGVGTVAYGHTARRQMQTRLDNSVTIFGNPPLVISSDRQGRFVHEPGRPSRTSKFSAKVSAKSSVNSDTPEDDVTTAVAPTTAPAVLGQAQETQPATRPSESVADEVADARPSVKTAGTIQDKAVSLKHAEASGHAYEPTLCQFLFRGLLFDASLSFMKLLPFAILMSVVAFWLVNDFGPVYDAMSYQKSVQAAATGDKKGFGWRNKPNTYNSPQKPQRSPYHQKKRRLLHDNRWEILFKTQGRQLQTGNKGGTSGGAGQKAGGKPNANMAKTPNPATKPVVEAKRIHFLATEELLLFDRPTSEMVEVNLLLLLYVSIWSVSVPLVFVIMKWMIVGCVRPGAHELFGREVQRHFFMWALSEEWMTPFLKPFEGTLMANGYYSLLGARIGWRTLVLGIGIYGDIDQWEIGSDSVIDGYVWQSHTFEDRIFWVEKTSIGDRCYVGKDSLLMGGASLGDDIDLLPLSCVWKLIELDPGEPGMRKKYEGSPAVESPASMAMSRGSKGATQRSEGRAGSKERTGRQPFQSTQ